MALEVRPTRGANDDEWYLMEGKRANGDGIASTDPKILH